MVLAEVESGKIESRTVRPGSGFSHEHPAGTGIAAEAAGGQKRTWTSSGEELAVLLILNVVPTAAE